MGKVLKRFWQEEDGSVLAVEWLFVATILVLGAAAALPAVREAVGEAAAAARTGR